jgi:hypothetical protein
MSDEYWATFSIYDHRQHALYRNSLILFDRVVIPIPTQRVGDLQPEEIESLSADADYLTREGVAVRFDWDPQEFHEWQKKTLDHEAVDAEALAKVLVKDPPYATRLQLSQRYNELASGLLPEGVDSVIAVPVYGTRERYEAVVKDLNTAELATLEIIFNHLPMPADDTPLENIVRLRNEPQFQDSLYHLRKWQTETVSELLHEADDERAMRAATRDFERWIREYNEAISDARMKKVETAIISVLAIGATLKTGAGPLIAALAAIAPPLFSFRELVKPCWKEVAHKECAPAGVIYAASQLGD